VPHIPQELGTLLHDCGAGPAAPAVAAAKVEGQHSVRLEPKCAERVLIRLEFGECAVTTKVKAPLRCGEKTCSFPWSPAPK